MYIYFRFSNIVLFSYTSGLVSDIMSILSILSIILMVIENELAFDNGDDHDTKTSWFIKLIISISTAILLALIFFYHYLDLKLYMNQNLFHSYIVGLTARRIYFLVIEILICAIHPMPRSYPHSDSKEIVQKSISYKPVDVGLGIPSK